MDLIFGYLIVFVILFATSLSLLYRDLGLKKNKFYIFSVIGGLFAFIKFEIKVIFKYFIYL